MAWTGNFKDRIDNLAGVLATTDDTAIEDWVRDGCYDVLDKAVGKYGDEEVWKFVAKSGNQTSNNIDVDEIRTISSVVRNGVYASKGKWQLKDKYADANSIYAATSNSPIWFIDDSVLTIYPTPSGGAPANYYFVPEYSITDWNTGTSSINNFPSEYYYHVMLYAAVQVLYRRMLDYTEETALSNLNITLMAPIAIPDPAIIAPDIPTFSAPDISANVPTYIAPAWSGGSLFTSLATKTITDLSITSVPPDTPTIEVVTYTPMDAVTVATTADMVDPGAISVTSITEASTGTPPVYTNPTVQGDSAELSQITAGVVGSAETDFDEWFHIAGQYIEHEEDSELAGSQLQKISAYISAFSTQMQNNLNIFNDANVEYQAQIQENTANANATNQAAIQNIGHDMARLQANLQKDIGEAQLNAGNAQAKAAQDALQTVQAIINENQSKMGKYQAELSVYSAEVNTEVQEYTQNFQKDLQIWTQENATVLQQRTQMAQDALNVFNKENVKYQASIQSVMAKHQADIQEATKEADLGMQKQIQNYTFELQKWQQNISNYQADVNTQVTEYTNNLQRFSSAMQAKTTSYTWLESQYGKLKSEYEGFFAADTPKAPPAIPEGVR